MIEVLEILWWNLNDWITMLTCSKMALLCSSAFELPEILRSPFYWPVLLPNSPSLPIPANYPNCIIRIVLLVLLPQIKRFQWHLSSNLFSNHLCRLRLGHSGDHLPNHLLGNSFDRFRETSWNQAEIERMPPDEFLTRRICNQSNVQLDEPPTIDRNLLHDRSGKNRLLFNNSIPV